MTFRDVAFRNFRGHMPRYMSYFLCSSFAIMIFFMFCTLVFNSAFTKAVWTQIELILYIGLVFTSVFSIFFISYANTSFIKSRTQEFGLFLCLGMVKRDIRKIILLENGLVGAAALAAGLVSGTVFSRLLFLFIIKLLDLPEVRFVLNYQSYAATAVTFFLVFSLVTLLGWRSIRKLDAAVLMKESRSGEAPAGFHPSLILLGMLSVIGAFFLLHLHRSGSLLPSQPVLMITLSVLICLAGVYILLRGLGAFLLDMVKKKKNTYYSKLLGLTEFTHRFQRNKKTFYMICVINMLIVFLIGVTYALYSTSFSLAEKADPNHFAYQEIGVLNRIGEAKRQEILKGSITPVVREQTLPFVLVKTDRITGSQKPLWVYVTRAKAMNESFSLMLDVPESKAEIIDLTPAEEKLAPLFPQTITLAQGNKSRQFEITSRQHERVLNRYSVTGSLLVVLNDKDYALYEKNAGDDYRGLFRLLNFKDWRKSGEVIKALGTELKKTFDAIPDRLNTILEKEYDYRPFMRQSTYGTYSFSKKQAAVALFVMTFISLLFFISACSVIYFKLYSEFEKAKEKYKKVFKLGILKSEIFSTLSFEMKLMLFVPFILGCVLGLTFSLVMKFSTLLEIDMSQLDVLKSLLVIISLYSAFQWLFYKIAAGRYSRSIINSL